MGRKTLGLTKHLLIAAGLLLAAVAFLVVRNWETFSLMYDNMTAMGEGGQLAQQIRYPDDLLTFIEDHPEGVSLVAYDVGAADDGIFFQADRPRPLVNVPHLLLLAEYARRTEAGQLDPTQRVPIDSVARYALPGAGQSRHQQAQAHWRAQGYLDADSTVALRHVVDAIARFSDGVAADWFIAQLGRDPVAALPAQFALADSEPPLPGSGTHLSWNNHTATGSVRDRISRYRDMARDAYADRVYRLTRTLRQDAAFRREERARLSHRGTDLSIRHQRALAQATYPHGTAADYADLMARTAQRAFHSDSVSAFLQHCIERTVTSDSIQTTFEAIGSKAGALPGIISFVGYVRRADGPPRVVALFMEQLPIGVFYHLMQTGLDKGFQVQLLTDDAFFRDAQKRLQDTTVATSAALERTRSPKAQNDL